MFGARCPSTLTLAQIIDSILDYSKLEADGKANGRCHPICPSDISRHSCEARILWLLRRESACCMLRLFSFRPISNVATCIRTVWNFSFPWLRGNWISRSTSSQVFLLVSSRGLLCSCLLRLITYDTTVGVKADYARIRQGIWITRLPRPATNELYSPYESNR